MPRGICIIHTQSGFRSKFGTQISQSPTLSKGRLQPVYLRKSTKSACLIKTLTFPLKLFITEKEKASLLYLL